MTIDGDIARFDVIVVGAGFSGLYALHHLRELGLRVRVLEKAHTVGGTWLVNRYPGARCDIESIEYSYSFSEEIQQEWVWTETMSAQPEIEAYLNFVADRLDLRRDIDFDTTVVAMSYSDEAAEWTVRTEGGATVAAPFVVAATGILSVPLEPSIPGMDRFTGTSLHTGRWPEGVVDLSGKRVGVVGTGTMASGIVEVFAKAGYDVVVRGRSDSKVEGSVALVRKSLDKAVARGKLDEAGRDAVLARISGTTALEDMAEVDLVVEAVAEELDVKRAMFGALDEICKPGAILATTTSSLPVVECAAVTSRPGDVIGMHFFNPAPVMKLVEVVSTIGTSRDVAATVLDVCQKLKKVPVSCGDRAGFIVNALLFPYLNDAVKMLEAHYATADDIDTAMKQGCALPMGPFELLDVVGNDVSLAIQRELYLEFREPGFAPAPLLEHLVTAGYLGRKTKAGFFKREKGQMFALNLETMEYEPRGDKPKFESTSGARGPAAKRIKKVVVDGEDNAAAFAREVTLRSLAYSARRLGEIADDIVN
ncbi:3-hydroxybutyryl-CoA dehydrogenase, partial [Mycolicibacterium poriferae]|uniref:3-hydroxybutyryl-CoA dehydrogenase n=1 Tax=Mycolicibacterium poriferae TaxID=39694 RepID=UPI003218E950